MELVIEAVGKHLLTCVPNISTDMALVSKDEQWQENKKFKIQTLHTQYITRQIFSLIEKVLNHVALLLRISN